MIDSWARGLCGHRERILRTYAADVLILFFVLRLFLRSESFGSRACIAAADLLGSGCWRKVGEIVARIPRLGLVGSAEIAVNFAAVKQHRKYVAPGRQRDEDCLSKFASTYKLPTSQQLAQQICHRAN